VTGVVVGKLKKNKEKNMKLFATLKERFGSAKRTFLALALLVMVGLPGMSHADAATQGYVDSLVTGVISDVQHVKGQLSTMEMALIGIAVLLMLFMIVKRFIRRG